jgi:hypothetical protein
MTTQAHSADQARLERGYRRVLACYPRSFRQESEDEIVAVLMSTAEEGQRRVNLAEALDLIRGALRMRLRPSSPRPRVVSYAVRLMCLGALAEVGAVITMIVTTSNVRSAVLLQDPGLPAASWHSIATHLAVDEALAPVVIFFWLWMAWANSQGRDWARAVSAVLFMLLTAGVLISLGESGAIFATADVIACSVQWAIGLAALALLCARPCWQFYRPEPEPAVIQQ